MSIPTPPSHGKHTLTCENGVLKWESNTQAQPSSPKQKLLIVQLGQSNAQSANKGPIDKILDAPHPRIKCWDRKKKMFTIAKDPLPHHYVAYDESVGFGLSASKEYLNYLGDDYEIYLAPLALGGSAFEIHKFACSWIKGTSTDVPLYDLAIKEINEMKQAVPDLQIHAFWWHQGETSVIASNPWNYFNRLSTLIADFRKDLGVPNAYFVIGTMLKSWRDTQDPNRVAPVHNTHLYLPTMTWLCETANLDDITDAWDGIHFTASAQREIGKRYASKTIMIKNQYDEAVKEWRKKN